VRLKGAMFADPANLGLHEAWAYQRDGDAFGIQLVIERLGEGAHRELAHRIGRGLREAEVPVDAPDQREAPPAPLQIIERRVDRPEHPEDVGLELTAEIIDREPLELPRDTEAGVGDDDIDLAERLAGAQSRLLDRAILTDVPGDGDRAPAHGLDLPGQ